MSGNREAAELSSMATTLDDLCRRLTSIAEALTGTDRDHSAQGLFEVERSLQEGLRRLNRMVEQGV